jgi:hypothetical protein
MYKLYMVCSMWDRAEEKEKGGGLAAHGREEWWAYKNVCHTCMQNGWPKVDIRVYEQWWELYAHAQVNNI